jgi:hypothetical protein
MVSEPGVQLRLFFPSRSGLNCSIEAYHYAGCAFPETVRVLMQGIVGLQPLHSL